MWKKKVKKCVSRPIFKDLFGEISIIFILQVHFFIVVSENFFKMKCATYKEGPCSIDLMQIWLLLISIN